MTAMIWGVSTVMAVKAICGGQLRNACTHDDGNPRYH
jgi:hypothetical protein